MPKKNSIADLLGTSSSREDLNNMDLLLLQQAQQAQAPEVSQAQLNALNAASSMAPVQAQIPKLSKTEAQQITPALADLSDIEEASRYAAMQPDVISKQDALQNFMQNIAPGALAPVQTDLSPFLALGDAWADKGNIAGAYKKPASYDDRQRVIMGLQNLIQQQESGLTDEEREFLKLALSGKKIETKTISEGKKDGGTRNPTLDFERYKKGFFDDPMKKAKSNIHTAIDLRNQLKSASSVGDATVSRRIARMFDTGALNRQDVTDFASPGAVTDQILNFVSKKGEGKLSDQARAAFLEFADNMLESSASDLQKTGRDYAVTVGQGVYGYDPETAYKNLGANTWDQYVGLKEKKQKEALERQKRIKELEAKE